ncbi:MAG TPA: SGNH/GDSL hydrolase family protein [Allosphingosinicella sp.]|nr:SGNH/GDSL hydrolase family protein [Allosphingosinicella sp.]
MTRRVTIFAKGNVDLRDTLHSKRIGGEVVWNGVNEIVRERHPDWRVRVRHETCNRSDAMVAADGTIPAALAGRALPLGNHPLESQFATGMYDAGNDVVILSLQPDVMNRLARHRPDGHLLYAEGMATWSEEDRAWFASHYEPTALLTPEQSMANLEMLVGRLHDHVHHVLVYTMSPIVPGERTHSHVGMAETLSWRIRRFNLALIELSRRLDFSIVDVDTLFARHGADRLKLDGVHIAAEGCRLVAEEVVSILAERGCFDA